ncbi:MATE family efflux transporter [Rhizobium sp. Root274]|uniref:MATE family efflux transporter n=1 Tax=unclassified Rhizobium TaxID=2613769 RepID=UPI000712C5F9|nr:MULTISPECIES: MATE family efflux transporter [unclassified Rhizobium]KQW29722.1 MATE family efflux transporter [Rhizobium sp. Root1240]KRD29914.1 MATE family efflux transporter [Rhizobium sp. Root274]
MQATAFSHANPSTVAGSWLSHVRATMSLGVPLIGAQLAQLGIHTTDVVIVGQLGAVPLAAMVLAGQFFFTIFIFGSGFSMAVIPMVAQAYGRSDVISVRRSIRMGMWVAILYTLLTAPLFYNAEAILLSLGQKPEVAALAAGYVRIIQFGLLPALLFAVLRALVSATGRARIVLWVTLGILVLNAILAYCLVLGHFDFPALGMTGAAIVAVIVQWVSFLAMVSYLQTREETKRYELFVRFWRPDWQAFREVLQLGLPISVTVLAEVSLFTGASLLMGRIGTIELAAHGIALQLASIAFMIPLGLSQAATVRVGVAHGRGNYAELVRAAITVTGIAAILSLTGGILFMAIPHLLAGAFLNEHTPDATDVLAYAGPLVGIAGIFQLVDGLQAIASGLLRGLKDARVPMIMALIAYWPIGFLLAWLLAFPLGVGGIGIWIGFVVGLASAAVMLCLRFYLKVRHEMQTARG